MEKKGNGMEAAGAVSRGAETVIWEPEALADALERALPAGLRALADALDAGLMTGFYLGHGVHGIGCGNDEMGMDVHLRLRVPLRQVREVAAHGA